MRLLLFPIRVLVSAPLAAQAKDAQGREKALREFVRGWLADHGHGGERFAAFHIHGVGKAREQHLDSVISGYFELSGPGERKVYFRANTSSHQLWSFELSQRELPYF